MPAPGLSSCILAVVDNPHATEVMENLEPNASFTSAANGAIFDNAVILGGIENANGPRSIGENRARKIAISRRYEIASIHK